MLPCLLIAVYSRSQLSQVSLAMLKQGHEIATCPSCSLMIRVLYDKVCKRCSGATKEKNRETVFDFVAVAARRDSS
jgi:hypothetical protein